MMMWDLFLVYFCRSDATMKWIVRSVVIEKGQAMTEKSEKLRLDKEKYVVL